jgi:hypothetical protein
MATKKTTKPEYVIVRTRSAGAFAGELASKRGTEVTLNRARRLWYWAGAFTLSGVAIDGVDVEGSKFGTLVSGHYLTDVIEVIPATAEARAKIEAVKDWAP